MNARACPLEKMLSRFTVRGSVFSRLLDIVDRALRFLEQYLLAQ